MMLKQKIKQRTLMSNSNAVHPATAEYTGNSTITVEFQDGVFVIPSSTHDGKLLSDEAAIATFRITGQHYGGFASVSDAEQFLSSGSTAKHPETQAKAKSVLTALRSHKISRKQALARLAKLGYSDQEAAYMLQESLSESIERKKLTRTQKLIQSWNDYP